METSLIDFIKMHTASSSSGKFILLNDVEYASIDELPEDADLKKAKIITRDSKGELYQKIFGKSRVGIDDLQELDKVIEDLKRFVIENASYATQKKFEKAGFGIKKK